MIRYSYGLNQLLKCSNIQVKELPKNALYEKGKIYWCGYWQQWYKVIHVVYDYSHNNCPLLKSVTVEWQDGSTGRHRTRLDSLRDYELLGVC